MYLMTRVERKETKRVDLTDKRGSQTKNFYMLCCRNFFNKIILKRDATTPFIVFLSSTTKREPRRCLSSVLVTVWRER